MSDCRLKAPGYVGIEVDKDANLIRKTLVDGALLYALSAYDSASTSLDVRGSTFINSGTGLYVDGGVDAVVDSTCYFYQNDTGIHLYNAGTSATIRSCGITWNTSGGVLCDASSAPYIVSNVFAHNGGGIYCSNSSSPRIEDNQIQSAGNAITVASSSNPDVGHSSPTGSQSSGDNHIAHAGKYIANSSGGTISAQNNCWDVNSGACSPASSKFTGSVDYSDPNCCNFDTFTHNEGEPEAEEGFLFQVPETETPKAEKKLVTSLVGIVPNPFNPQTSIHYSLSTRSKVEIKIFDVQGRLIDTLANETQVAGQHSVVWRGTDRRGSAVASGIYFVRMSAPGQVFTRKMLLLK